MLKRSPISAFSSVDFPAFGAPTMATCPARVDGLCGFDIPEPNPGPGPFGRVAMVFAMTHLGRMAQSGPLRHRNWKVTTYRADDTGAENAPDAKRTIESSMTARIRALAIAEGRPPALSRALEGIEAAGVDVAWADGTNEGLRRLDGVDPMVVLLAPDAGASGVDALRRLQGQADGVPVLIVADLDVREAVRLLRMGAENVLPLQDLDPSELRLAVSDAIDAAGQARQEAEIERIRADFVAAAAHELRTPLSIVREYITLVHDGIVGPLNAEQRECLGSARDNCDRLGELIDGTLDLRAAEAGATQLRRGRLDVSELVRSVVRDFRPQTERRDLSLTMEVEEHLPWALACRSSLTQVLVNVLGNAVKFAPAGGHIRVRARLDEDRIVVDVTDDGPGIPSLDRERIFERFVRLHDADDVSGSGLGLAICRAILRAHDGEIGVESPPAGGATFRFDLPVYTERRELESMVRDAGAARIDKDRVGIGVIVVRPLGPGILCSDARAAAPVTDPGGDAAAQDVSRRDLRTLRETFERTLRRTGDRTLMLEASGYVAVTAEVEAGGLDALRDRIERAAGDCLGGDRTVVVAASELRSERRSVVLVNGLEAQLARRTEERRRALEPRKRVRLAHSS